MRVKILFAVLLTAGMVTLACQSKLAQPNGAGASGVRIQVDGGSYIDISAGQLNTMLKSKNFFLVNVHVPYDGEIAQTDAFIPYDKIEENLGKLPAAKDARIVLYCRSGSMSAIAARTLVRLGYTSILNLDGGMTAWREAGFNVIRK